VAARKLPKRKTTAIAEQVNNMPAIADIRKGMHQVKRLAAIVNRQISKKGVTVQWALSFEPITYKLQAAIWAIRYNRIDSSALMFYGFIEKLVFLTNSGYLASKIDWMLIPPKIILIKKKGKATARKRKAQSDADHADTPLPVTDC